MKTLLLISQHQNIIDRVKGIFSSEYALFTMNYVSDTLEFLNTTPVDVVIVDAENVFYEAVRLTKDIKKLSPTSLMICLLNAEEAEGADEEDTNVFDFILQKPLVSAGLRTVVQKAFETHKLTQEVTLFREQLALSKGNNALLPVQLESPPLSLERILAQFAQALSASFDLDKMCNLFLDTVDELVSPNRMSLFLYNRSSNIVSSTSWWI